MERRVLSRRTAGAIILAAGIIGLATAPAVRAIKSRHVASLHAALRHTGASKANASKRPYPGVKTAPSRSFPHLLDYNRDIVPILGANCFVCHGPDPGARQAGLRLDMSDSAYKATASGKIPIVPGHPEKSELYYKITASDAARMPPSYSAKSLTPAQIATLKLWIEQGAKYEPHWAYIKPVRPPLPAVKNPAWRHNPIDRFIMAGLEAAHVSPSPLVDRRTLIRRVSLDIIGLPPTMQEVSAFVNDKSPNAYEKVVDRLLASPHFGERMAIRWLDLVRYADTDGYHGDQFRSVFPYRDYVINSYNEDKPFDQFTIEQLAGDLLPNATMEQKVASGYNRLNMITREGGAQPKEYLAKYAADRVRTTSIVWQATTIGCAECHDHKFDPVTSKDFYSFEAFFADIKQQGVYQNDGPVEPDMAVPSSGQTAALADLERQEKSLKASLDAPNPTVDEEEKIWEQSEREKIASWTTLKPASAQSKRGATLTTQPDESILASGTHPTTDTYTITTTTTLRGITAFRIEALPDPSLPKNGPGRADNGNFVLTGLTVTAKPAGSAMANPITLQNATATWEQKSGADALPGKVWSAALVLDPKKTDKSFGWAILERVGQPSAAVFETASDIGDGGPVTLTFKLDFSFPAHQIGRLRISAATLPRPVRAMEAGAPQDVQAALLIDPAQRTPAEEKALADHYRSIAPALQPLRDLVAGMDKRVADLKASIPRTLVTVAVMPAVIRVLPRGNWMDNSGEIVKPAVPQFMGQLPAGEPANRLALAKWIVSRDNPLTARVVVNRLWDNLFGAGIVRTVDDFGTQGAPPTHPHLLDWLAVQFMDNGWHVKPIIKLIVMSNAYKQSSHATPAMLERDPFNDLIARQGRFRLPAEMIRDNALSIAGLLSPRIGGRSVFPYQPDHYWDNCNTFTGKLIYTQDHGANLYRRGLYTIWKRSFLNPSLLAFDAPPREECTAYRTVSNTPLQALVLLDDPTYVEAARVFAEHILDEGGDTTASRINYAFRRALFRPVQPKELAVLAALQRKSLADYTSDKASAKDLVSVGETPVPKNIDVSELASWTSVARTILNLSETITRE